LKATVGPTEVTKQIGNEMQVQNMGSGLDLCTKVGDSDEFVGSTNVVDQ